ncbi:penicillin acylase family protein, partial [Streptomyces sp. NPDC006307]|uniref:penicillin acylase family protein n=1 Tax=Streptomyces sp. NPDC006307 TaxID=3156748 RepID=UPI0033B80015
MEETRIEAADGGHGRGAGDEHDGGHRFGGHGRAAAGPGPDRPTIRYTEYGIPHIIASNWEDLGTGYGYAAAKDNICTLADTYLMVNAQRSRYLGPDGRASPGQDQNTTFNLNSDLYFQRIKDNRVVERLLDQP